MVAPLIICAQVLPGLSLRSTVDRQCRNKVTEVSSLLMPTHSISQFRSCQCGPDLLPLILLLAVSGKCVRYIEWQKESESEVAQLCLTLCDPMNCGLPGSSIRGILQARTLEWGAISFSRGSSRPRDRTLACHTAGGLYSLSRQRRADRKPYPAFIVP